MYCKSPGSVLVLLFLSFCVHYVFNTTKNSWNPSIFFNNIFFFEMSKTFIGGKTFISTIIKNNHIRWLEQILHTNTPPKQKHIQSQTHTHIYRSIKSESLLFSDLSILIFIRLLPDVIFLLSIFSSTLHTLIKISFYLIFQTFYDF